MKRNGASTKLLFFLLVLVQKHGSKSLNACSSFSVYLGEKVNGTNCLNLAAVTCFRGHVSTLNCIGMTIIYNSSVFCLF